MYEVEEGPFHTQYRQVEDITEVSNQFIFIDELEETLKSHSTVHFNRDHPNYMYSIYKFDELETAIRAEIAQFKEGARTRVIKNEDLAEFRFSERFYYNHHLPDSMQDIVERYTVYSKITDKTYQQRKEEEKAQKILDSRDWGQFMLSDFRHLYRVLNELTPRSITINVPTSWNEFFETYSDVQTVLRYVAGIYTVIDHYKNLPNMSAARKARLQSEEFKMIIRSSSNIQYLNQYNTYVKET